MCYQADFPELHMSCPITLEEFMLDNWLSGYADDIFGHVDEVGWHVFGIKMQEGYGGYFLTTTHTGSTSITVATTDEEYDSECATIEAEVERFYADWDNGDSE